MQNKKHRKINVNIYFDFPFDIYLEINIHPEEKISNIVKYIEQVYPKTKFAYNCDNPIFMCIETGCILETSKSFIENNLNQESCSIKIKLKIKEIK
jgi:hypothetical protein